jgi:hypothetical protein
MVTLPPAARVAATDCDAASGEDLGPVRGSLASGGGRGQWSSSMTKGSASWRLFGDDDLAAFEAFLGPQATAEDLTPAAVRSTATRSNASGAATVAKHFSALRGLADAVGADAAIDQDALDAIAAWVKVRPPAASEHLLLSLPRTGQPPRALTTRDVARIVAPYAETAGLPEDRRTPHVLRHTFWHPPRRCRR